MLKISEIPFLRIVFFIVFAIIGIACLLALVYGIVSKRFTDKLVAANMITTFCLNAICMIAVYEGEDYILDVALVYAILSFAAIAVLSKLLEQKKKSKEEEGRK